jgi:signal transduction histidine kinase
MSDANIRTTAARTTVAEPDRRPPAPAEPKPNGFTPPPADLGTIMQAYHEVTERLRQSHDRLQEQVQALRIELADKNRELARRERLAALGEMAAGVAHEIRNPLGSIQLFASLLDRDLADRPAERGIVGKISRGVQSLDRIVTDTLAFAGEAEPALRVVEFKRLLAGVVELVAAEINDADVDMTVTVVPEDLRGAADPDLLLRALTNLVLNGVQAAGEKGRIDLRVGATGPDKQVEITVADDGPGIAPELLDRIFNPFFTTRDTGTGLGLAIVHRIIEAHGGVISASNRDTGGASFRIILPAPNADATRNFGNRAEP